MSRLRVWPMILLVLAANSISGCAAYRSDMGGAYTGPARVNQGAARVRIAFMFTHFHQNKGWDVIPKMDNENRYVNGFNDFFRDALPEITNIGSYATFTERPDDVTSPRRRAEQDSIAAGNDYVVRMRFMRETSFAREALGTILSSVTLTTFPVPYTSSYSVTADVYDRDGRLVRRYERHASVTRWVETLLIFAYPFYPESRKTDEVYLNFLHNTFRAIEADGILK
jgi:hypothetical protein